MTPTPNILRDPSVDPQQPAEAQVRWDERYRDGCSPGRDQVSPWLLKHEYLLKGGRALDVACGRGRHSLWLAELGYDVDAVDISAAALQILAQRVAERGLNDHFRLIQADLMRWRPEPDCYDLVLVTRYLNRQLWPFLAAALKPGGLLIYRSFHTDRHRLRPDLQRNHMLQPGELLQAFPDMELLAYEERRLSPGGTDVNDCTASIIVRRPR